jgi:hypothetical protein
VSTSDAEDLAWSPAGDVIAVWDSPLSYNVTVYRLDGTRVAQFSAYDRGLGVRGVQWSAAGEFLAIGSYDQVRCQRHCGHSESAFAFSTWFFLAWLCCVSIFAFVLCGQFAFPHGSRALHACRLVADRCN